MVSASPAPSLIGLDWGTSSLRAYLMRDGRVLDSRQSRDGVQALAAGRAQDFEHAFAAVAGEWLTRWPALPVVACGMVGSAQGWREAPYVRCPVDTRALCEHGVTVASGPGSDVLIAPGVLFEPERGPPDVMRGEETQVVGALQHDRSWSARACFVLPGTHSKWVRVEDGRICSLSTAMTGELFAVLREHSILGRLMAASDGADAQRPAAAFARGLDDSRAESGGGLLHRLFAVRTLGLTGKLSRDSLADYLSGLLIGEELGAALASHGKSDPLVLVGEPALCARYASALRHFGASVDALLDNTAPAGLWALARAKGLVAT
jgi:2-dehydro-3-deoxygalactonokinase